MTKTKHHNDTGTHTPVGSFAGISLCFHLESVCIVDKAYLPLYLPMKTKCPKIYEVINAVSVSYIVTRNYFLLVLIVFKNVTLCALNISYPSFVNLG